MTEADLTGQAVSAAMNHPPHPGGMFIEFCLPGTGSTIESAASYMGLDPGEFTEVCYERAALTAEMAVRVSKAFGSTPEAWMRMQAAYDIALAREAFGAAEIERLRELTEAELDALEVEGLPETAEVAD